VPAPVPRPRIYAPAPVAPSFNLVIPLNIR
jgi:hypothetical protein